jgi:hypothetical protein
MLLVWFFAGRALSDWGGQPLWVRLFFGAVALTLAAAARGLWRRRRWGLRTATLLYGTFFLVAMVGAVSAGQGEFPVTLVTPFLFFLPLGYLLQRRVRQAMS